MKTIYKYPLKIQDEQEIEMPPGAMVIHAGLDPNKDPCVWALVDRTRTRTRTSDLVPIKIRIAGDGRAIEEVPLIYVNSFVQGPFIWHVFIFTS